MLGGMLDLAWLFNETIENRNQGLNPDTEPGIFVSQSPSLTTKTTTPTRQIPE